MSRLGMKLAPPMVGEVYDEGDGTLLLANLGAMKHMSRVDAFGATLRITLLVKLS